MHSITTRLVVCLGLVGVALTQFLGPTGRPHPIHSQRAQEFNNMLTMASLFGFDMSELLMWNALGGENNFMLNQVPARLGLGLGLRPNQQLQRTLTLLGVLDGPDAPDPVGPPASGRKGRGKGAGGGGGGGGGGEREGGPPPKGGGKGRGKGRGKKRGNNGRNGAGAGAGK